MAEDFKRFIRDVPDFPKKGIVFKDISPLLSDSGAFRSSIEQMAAFVTRPDAVVAIESRGFIFGAGLALHWGVRFVAARKFGKLPGHTVREQYSLEYGEDVLELQADSLSRGQKVVIVDDLLATGGTAEAVGKLAERQGARVLEFAFVVELSFLNGRKRLGDGRVFSLIQY